MLKILIISVACAWLVIAAYAYFYQVDLIYHPTRDVRADPSDHGFEFEDVTIAASDGVGLHAWFIPREAAQGVVLFFHGNGGNIADRPLTLARLHELGWHVLMLDYRGYGNSEGSPNENGTYLDAASAWAYLREERGFDPQEIVIYGRSLGGAVAIELANQVHPRAIIVESSFTSLAAMARAAYPYLPVSLLLRFEYPSLKRIGNLSAPVFIAHSDDDELIPLAHGHALYARAKAPKQFYTLAGSHNQSFVRGGEAYYRALGAFMLAPNRIDPARVP